MQYLGIEYREAEEGEEADALIKWARVSALGGDFWGSNQTLGRTDRKLDGKVIRSTVTFLDSQLWTILFPRLRYIAGHEAGHALGIGGHSRSGSDLMGLPVPRKSPSQEDFNTLALGY
jgi:predicted Zn-dependent protease